MPASQVQLSTDNVGVFHVPQVTGESAAKASELLQENHEKHHIFFNASGFHNHIAHHMLTLYALGASPEIMQKQYDDQKSAQRPPQPLDDEVLKDLHDCKKFHEYLGNERYYHDYLVFFEGEIDKKGYEAVINEYVLQGDERANDMFVRMHAGFLHPMIHLGFGVEFKQPAIIAEALAQAAVHDSWIGPFLLGAEKAAETTGKGKNMVNLLDEIRADKNLSEAAHWDDGNKIRDGIMVRAPDEAVKHASQWKVGKNELVEKNAEMTNAVVYYTGGAQHPPKLVKYDFYYMHCVNCSIFYDGLLEQTWISDVNKARLLEWKGRLDLCMYASRRSPEPLVDEILNYKPTRPANSWADIFDRVLNHPDDGHASKLVRALAHGEQLCKGHDDDQRFRIKDRMWLQLGHMAIDSVESPGKTWVRSTGFAEAWTDFEDRPRAQL